MQVTNLNVIVCGAGIGGATAALLLARAGAHVTLLEKVQRPLAVGAGIGLAENGLAVLESLGLGPALASGHLVRGVRVTDASGRTLLAPPGRAPRIVMLRRATLQKLLLDAVCRERRIDCRLGIEVLGVTAEGMVQVDAGGHALGLGADLVIGADGVHSCVRECGAFGARVFPTGVRYVRALAAGDGALEVEAWTPSGVFGSFAVDGGTYLYASCRTPALRAALDARDLGAFTESWRASYPAAAPLLATLTSFDDLLVNEVIRVECDRFVDGRLVLLGDAAHAMAPNLGQGANSALVDAAVLLDELRTAPDLGAALNAYDERRRPAVRAVANLAGRLGALAEVTGRVRRMLRDRILLPVASRLSSSRTTRKVLQELPGDLLAIGES